ncbi:chromatin assembly factor I P60 subunit, putative [Ixodes scapularis]|uniref:Chromatin assembly factor I P60 subunit, putative n=1 Tax=Ixodes scapularis TaxID=6945 RepID=B7QN04_IXOSC|nr:chromatin assembly factor I P60 subunit, putative [Ixodes scapularis]|eukprot:XP_002400481.1 chromatin assembly factor I P60 subunit, putative [Ixodes scapularis]
MVWFVILHNNGNISLEFRSDLNRHTKTVNVVRFSNNEANIILWKQQEKESGDLFDESIENKEHWVVHKGKASRLFYDDTLKSFCRRLAFSPDGELLVTPCGIIEHEEGKVTNTVYVFARTNLSELPYRMVFAVATQNAILLYDTEQSSPFAHITNIHYTRLSDLTWSPDGLVLVASSTDGFCSIITFGEGEIGKIYDGELPFKAVIDEAR